MFWFDLDGNSKKYCGKNKLVSRQSEISKRGRQDGLAPYSSPCTSLSQLRSPPFADTESSVQHKIKTARRTHPIAEVRIGPIGDKTCSPVLCCCAEVGWPPGCGRSAASVALRGWGGEQRGWGGERRGLGGEQLPTGYHRCPNERWQYLSGR